MPNYCYYEMKAKGKKENVDKLISYLQTDYGYNDDGTFECKAEKHFYRVFEAHISDRYDNYQDDSDFETSVIISGDCAWSVSSCMLNEEHSYYYKDIQNKDLKDFKGTHMEEVTKDLDLVVEIFSEESGGGFMEHYLINKGAMEIEECVEWKELYDEDGERLLDEDGNPISEGGLEWEYNI